MAATAKRRSAGRKKQRSPDRKPLEPQATDNDDRDSTADPPSPDSSKSGGNLLSSKTMWLALFMMVIGVLVYCFEEGIIGGGQTLPIEPVSEVPIPADYDGQRAMGYLNRLCEFGPRPSASPAMLKQQEYLSNFFSEQGATVVMQQFQARHPETGQPVTMANLIARWGIDRPKRFLLCAHYDTRPFPDSDRVNRKGVFVGANDGASGTAGLMEISHHFQNLPADIGIDIVLFDGEEFIYQQGRDDYFLGSTHFATSYQSNPPEIPYQSGILLDMIGDRELKLYYEQNSLKFARDVARDVWKTAKRLKVKAFVPRIRHNVSDDHLPLNKIAKIPTIDIIDFDYPRPGRGQPSYWHTEQDVPANCSGESIAAVVWVVHQWILNQ